MIDKREVLETASALGLLPIQEPAWPNLLSGQGRLPWPGIARLKRGRMAEGQARSHGGTYRHEGKMII